MNLDAMLNFIKEVSMPPQDLEDVPDFLLVKNRVPLTEAQKARLAAIKIENPNVEEKWQRNRRLYEQEGDRMKALAAAKAEPARREFFAKKAAEAAEIKAVKVAARAQKGKAI